MPLLLCDLDNTLVDRQGAVERWARAYAIDRTGDADLAAAIVAADGEGLRPKPEVSADLARLLGLSPAEESGIITVLRAGVLQYLTPDPTVIPALDAAARAGWSTVVVTNGNVAQQENKMTICGLWEHVAGIVVSDTVGVRKPDPAIFTVAAERVGLTLEGAWMVGDAADTDILGAVNAGIRSVWLDRGRQYPADLPRPTATAGSFTDAVAIVLGA